MSNIEECLEFKNEDGMLLRGILHYGDAQNYQKIALVCLNTGLNDMAGWHRIQVKTARFLAENGYDVFRYDDTGIGDSEGVLESSSIVDIFSDIETGLFVGNANAAVDLIVSRFKDHKVVYLGFCGGALTAIHSAAMNSKIQGVIAIGGPVTLSSNDYLHKLDPWAVEKNVRKYKDKIFNFRAWTRLLTFRGDYMTIWSSVINYIKHKMKGEYKDKGNDASIDAVKNLNRAIFNSFDDFVKRKCPCLFFYAEHDSATWEFEKHFLPRYQEKFFYNNKLNNYVVAPQANHILSSRASQKILHETIIRWLRHDFISGKPE